jgi:hypothetical protein
MHDGFQNGRWQVDPRWTEDNMGSPHLPPEITRLFYHESTLHEKLCYNNRI